MHSRLIEILLLSSNQIPLSLSVFSDEKHCDFVNMQCHCMKRNSAQWSSVISSCFEADKGLGATSVSGSSKVMV